MTEEGVLGPKGSEEAEAVRSVVSALMHELECILHEYLSYNWDRWACFPNLTSISCSKPSILGWVVGWLVACLIGCLFCGLVGCLLGGLLGGWLDSLVAWLAGWSFGRSVG
jgi:hypothetical protein